MPGTARLRRRDQDRLIVAGAAVAGAALAVEPTGTPVLDQLWCAAFVAGIAWAGGHARREVVLAVAVVTAALAATGLSLGLAVAAVAVAAIHALLPRGRRRVNTLAAGLIALALLTGNGPAQHWQAALTTGLLVAVLAGVGLRSTTRRRRRTALAVLGATVLAATLATALAGAAYLVARPDADRATDAFRAAGAAGRSGDLDEAQARFRAAEQHFGDARSTIGWLALPGRAVPGVAQQVHAAHEVLAAAEDAVGAARTTTGTIRLDRLQVRGGTIDLAAIAEVEAPAADLVTVLDRTLVRLERVDRRLLATPVSATLDDALAEVHEAGRDAERLQRAVTVAPDLLGATVPRRYLVLFTTPVEARNRFGFPGTYAVLRFDGGRLTFDGAGPISELFPESPVDQRRLRLPPRAQPYQPYGVSREWRNVTIPAHFPAAADTIVQLAAQSPLGGIDGVLLAGPETAAAVVGLVGDVELADPPVTLTEDTVVEFVTRRQYLEFPEPGDRVDRRDLLADIAEVVGGRLETVTLPELGELFDTFSPLVRSGQLALSVPPSVSPQAADLLASSDLDGAMPDPAVDLLHVGNVNASGSKIDLYLQRSLTYDVQVAPDGTVAAELTVELENRAPDSGLPRYLIGSVAGLDLPLGTNRTTVLVYSPHRLESLAIDRQPVPFTTITDGSLFVYQAQLDLGPGQARTLVARLAGAVPDGEDYRLELLPNGLVEPDEVTVALADERSGTRGEQTLRVETPVRIGTERGGLVTLR